MGIGIKNMDWFSVVQKNRLSHPCLCEKSENKGKYCAFHGYMMSAPLTDHGNIKCSEEMKKFFNHNRLKKDENGRILPSTERGKRRAANRK